MLKTIRLHSILKQCKQIKLIINVIGEISIYFT